MPPDTLRAAIDYLERGWTPVPLQPRSKLPLVSWGRLRHSEPRAEDLEQWWSWWPEANVGIITGTSSHLVVVDLDGPEAQALAEQLGLPDAPTVRTGEGLHVYCSAMRPMRSAVGLRPGIDLRADGGYIVAPPSVHPSGRPYAWVVPPGNVLPPLPLWAVLAAEGPLEVERQPHWVVAALQGVEEGKRNATCARLTGHLLAHGHPHDVVEAFLLAWNFRNRPPLPEGELRRTIVAIMSRGHKQRAQLLPGLEGTLLEYFSGQWAQECTHGERSTYQAVCIIEYERGLPLGGTMHVSYRELNNRGAVSPQRCGPVLRRLASRGYLEFHPGKPGLNGQAATLRRLPLPPIQR